MFVGLLVGFPFFNSVAFLCDVYRSVTCVYELKEVTQVSEAGLRSCLNYGYTDVVFHGSYVRNNKQHMHSL